MADGWRIGTQELEQARCCAIGKAEHDAVLKLARDGVAADTAHDVKALLRRAIDGAEVVLLHVGEDAVAGASQARQMALDVALCAERQIHERLMALQPARQRRQHPA